METRYTVVEYSVSASSLMRATVIDNHALSDPGEPAPVCESFSVTATENVAAALNLQNGLQMAYAAMKGCI